MKKILILAVMLGATFTAYSCTDEYENEQTVQTTPSDTILECQQWINTYDKEVWAEKCELTIKVLEYCAQVPDLQGCRMTQYVSGLRNEPEDVYELMGMVDEFRDYNKGCFMDTVEESEEFAIYMHEVLNLTYEQYWEKYYGHN